MKNSIANPIRTNFINRLMSVFADEDVGMIASNSFNLPVVAEDGTEGWVEIVVKIPKDGGDDGYLKRQQYEIDCKDKAEKAKAKAESKAAKVAKDKARREAKKSKVESAE